MPPNLKAKSTNSAGIRKICRGECRTSNAPKPCPNHDSDRSTTNEEADEVEADHELDVGEIVRRWQQSSWQPSVAVRRRFLLQLAVALHSYGSSASRTEYLIDKAAHRLDVETNIAVFPSLTLLSFPGSAESNLSTGNIPDSSTRKKERRSSHKRNHISFLSRKEMHMLTVESDMDLDKLGHVDELTNRVGKAGTPFAFAYWRLKTILNSPPIFDKWARLLGYAMSAAASAPLCFGGGVWDAFFSFILGTVVGTLDMIASSSAMFSTIWEFASAFWISFLAKCFTWHFKNLDLCYISLTLGSLTQLLPGMALTLGASEMISKSHVTGSADIVRGLYSSMQLGFGLAMGENLVWWAGDSTSAKCVSQELPLGWKFIVFLGYAIGSNILLMARFEQWPGMTITAFAGYLVSNITESRLTSSTASAISAFAVGITGNAYSYITGELPLAMIISGINLLVPGGIGVQSIATMLKESATSGVGFVFEMVVVALSLTIGLLIAKLAMPAALQTNRPINFRRSNLTTLMVDIDQATRESSSSSSDRLLAKILANDSAKRYCPFLSRQFTTVLQDKSALPLSKITDLD